jgi:hypothetical protein
MKTFVTISETLQSIEAKLNADAQEVRCTILKRKENLDFNVSISYTMPPAFEVHEDNLCEAYDALEEDLILSVSSFFRFETWVRLQFNEIVISTKPID